MVVGGGGGGKFALDIIMQVLLPYIVCAGMCPLYIIIHVILPCTFLYAISPFCRVPRSFTLQPGFALPPCS